MHRRWPHGSYAFTEPLASWQPIADLGWKMRTIYDEAGDKRSVQARHFFQACATAIASKPVQDALSTFRLTKGFRITIPHPDTDEEFYPPSN